MTSATPPASCPASGQRTRPTPVQTFIGAKTPTGVPVYRPDLYSDAAIGDPYPHYAAMRGLGPVVWLPKQRLYALPRYAEVKSVLSDPDTFRSRQGVALNPISRTVGNNSLLMTDGAPHDQERKLMLGRLTPRALRPLQAQIDDLAERTVLEALANGRVDGVRDMALKLPMTIIPDLIGWPERGRRRLVEWAGAIFDMLGPLNRQSIRSIPSAVSMMVFVHRLARRGDVVPGSMSDEMFQRVKEGTLARSRITSTFIDYLAPSVDTTASAIAAALYLFAHNPDQWRLLQADPARVPNAVNEVVRMESPVRAFGRRTEVDTEIAGTAIPAGSQLLVLFASANRDERMWRDPDRFDIERDAVHHVGFGYGAHGCAGQGLARLETQAILHSLLRHVDRIELDGTPKRARNNIIHRFEALPVRLVPKR